MKDMDGARFKSWLKLVAGIGTIILVGVMFAGLCVSAWNYTSGLKSAEKVQVVAANPPVVVQTPVASAPAPAAKLEGTVVTPPAPAPAAPVAVAPKASTLCNPGDTYNSDDKRCHHSLTAAEMAQYQTIHQACKPGDKKEAWYCVAPDGVSHPSNGTCNIGEKLVHAVYTCGVLN